MFPTENLPLNVQFIHENFLDGLSYPDNFFDYIHQRALGIAFTRVQWETFVIKELTRVLKPHGWVEFVEGDLEIRTKGQASQIFSKNCK